MKAILRFLGTIFVLAAILAILYGLYYVITLKRDVAPAFTPEPTASSSPVASTTTPGFDMSVFGRVATSTWQTYRDPRGFSLKYPANLILEKTGIDTTLSFPREKYFKWPLLDNVSVVITVATTCPPLPAGFDKSTPTTEVTLNGTKYDMRDAIDHGAGQVYETIMFEAEGYGRCHLIVYNSHSTNGASFYVDDKTLIKQYDDEHAANAAKVKDIFYGIVSSYRMMI